MYFIRNFKKEILGSDFALQGEIKGENVQEIIYNLSSANEKLISFFHKYLYSMKIE